MTEPTSASAGRRPVLASGGRLGGWATAALLVGLVSLGLPWGDLGSPGYATTARVPVVAAGIAVFLGWRLRSRGLVRVGIAFAVVAVMMAHLVGSGTIALTIAIVLVVLGLRRTSWPG